MSQESIIIKVLNTDPTTGQVSLIPLRTFTLISGEQLLRDVIYGISSDGLQTFAPLSFQREGDIDMETNASARLVTFSRPTLYRGPTSGRYGRQNEATSENVGLTTGLGSALIASPGEWSISQSPASATQATVTRAAVAGARHVCRSISVSLAAVVAQGPINFILRDGASGMGASLWQVTINAAAGDGKWLALDGLNIVGSENTAMTLESNAAPAPTNFAAVALSGYDATTP